MIPIGPYKTNKEPTFITSADVPKRPDTAPEQERRELGGTAVMSASGLYGNGVVAVEKGPGIPIAPEDVGPMAIRQNFTAVGGNRYVVPAVSQTEMTDASEEIEEQEE